MAIHRVIRVLLQICALTVFVVLVGCGGGGGKGTPLTSTSLPVTGTVLLPPGSNLQLADLRVVGALGASSIASDGKFTLAEPDTGPALIGLYNRSDQLLLMGYAEAGVGGASSAKQTRTGVSGEISAKQTAVALLFEAVGGPLLPATMWKQALGIIAASPQADQVAGVIATQVAASPTALQDGNVDVSNAIATAAAALVPPVAVPGVSRERAVQHVFSITRESGDFSKIVVNTPSPQSGVSVLPNPEGNGLIITNDYRRHLKYFIYRTGYLDDADARHDIAWEELTNGFLPATTGATSTIGTLVDLVNGVVQYAGNKTQPINLPMNPTTAKRTFYTIVVVGGGQDTSVPAILSNAPTSLKNEWVEAANNMTMFLVVKEYMLPIVFTVIPAGRIAKILDVNQQSVNLAIDFVKIFTKGGVDLATPIAAHNYKGAVGKFITAIATNATMRSSLFQLLMNAGIISMQGNAAELVASSAAKLLILLKVVDTFYTTVDIGIVTAQVMQCSTMTGWEAIANKPTVKINPQTANIRKDTPVSLSCQVADVTGNFAYHWSTSGAYGHLEDDRGHSGKEFDSTMGTVRFVPGTIEDGKKDTVTVIAYLIPDGGIGAHINLGTGSAILTCVASNTYTIPSFVVDDNMTLWLNDTVIAEDVDGAYAGSRGPFSFEANHGDKLRLQVRDYYGHYASVSDVFIVKPDGTTFKWISAVQEQTPPGTHKIICDETWTVQ